MSKLPLVPVVALCLLTGCSSQIIHYATGPDEAYSMSRSNPYGDFLSSSAVYRLDPERFAFYQYIGRSDRRASDMDVTLSVLWDRRLGDLLHVAADGKDLAPAGPRTKSGAILAQEYSFGSPKRISQLRVEFSEATLLYSPADWELNRWLDYIYRNNYEAREMPFFKARADAEWQEVQAINRGNRSVYASTRYAKNAPIYRAIVDGVIMIGMTKEDVRQVRSSPPSRSYTDQFAGFIRDSWFYGDDLYIFEDGLLTSIHTQKEH